MVDVCVKLTELEEFSASVSLSVSVSVSDSDSDSVSVSVSASVTLSVCCGVADLTLTEWRIPVLRSRIEAIEVLQIGHVCNVIRRKQSKEQWVWLQGDIDMVFG